MDYSATDKNKAALTRSGAAAQVTVMLSTRWANTVAITSLTVVPQTSSFAAGSTFNLYGRIG